MQGTARKTSPAPREAVKAQVTAADKGSESGQWSARKAQRATAEYQRRGGDAGPKTPDNHLDQWMREAWGTCSGTASGETGGRTLPCAACEALAEEEYTRSTAAKRRGTQRQGSRGIAWNSTSRRASQRISAPW